MNGSSYCYSPSSAFSPFQTRGHRFDCHIYLHRLRDVSLHQFLHCPTSTTSSHSQQDHQAIRDDPTYWARNSSQRNCCNTLEIARRDCATTHNGPNSSGIGRSIRYILCRTKRTHLFRPQTFRRPLVGRLVKNMAPPDAEQRRDEQDIHGHHRRVR